MIKVIVYCFRCNLEVSDKELDSDMKVLIQGILAGASISLTCRHYFRMCKLNVGLAMSVEDGGTTEHVPRHEESKLSPEQLTNFAHFWAYLVSSSSQFRRKSGTTLENN